MRRLCWILAGCLPSCTPSPEPPQQVVLVVCDTLRADHLSLYGYSRPTSPNLEQLAQESTVYHRAQAAAPWTLPSHASIFTGLYPSEHGARTWSGDDLKDLRDKGWSEGNNVGPLAAHHTTLAELFQAHGWATGAVVANVAYMHERYGIAQGFDSYQRQRGPVEEITRRALQFIEAHKHESFFLFVNLMDTHRPYNVRPHPPIPDRSSDGNLLKRLVPLILDPNASASPELLDALKDQYDTAIANLDEGLGDFFQTLRKDGLYDNMCLMVTSDHGEFLGEHDLIEHSKDVYQGTLHVPLIVKAPGQTKRMDDHDWIGHVHLPGLILDALNHSETDSPLRSHWPRRDGVLSENYDSRVHDLRAPWGDRFRRSRRVLVSGSLKTILSSDGNHETYNLLEDPQENLPLMADETQTKHQESALESFGGLKMAPPGGAVELDEEAMRAMEQLGYGGNPYDSR
ncbi:MAG: sulfatase [Planctomycetota bacterium]|nr:sulfatase [Planctomycetota bacterium]